MQENSPVLVSAFPGLELLRSLLSSSKVGIEGAVCKNWTLGVETIVHLLYVTNDGLRSTSSFLDKVRLGEVSSSTFTIGIELDESESLRTNSKCELTVLDGGSIKYVCLCPRPLMVIFP